MTMKPPCLWSAWLLAGAAALVLAVAAGAETTPSPCADCHGDLATQFGGSPHGRAFALDEQYAAASCESCHGPGQAHIDAGDGSQIVNPAKASPAQADAACLTCHEKGTQHAFWIGSPHQSAGVSCASCHPMHTAPAVTRSAWGPRESTQLCLSCHVSMRKAMNQRSRHPLAEGKMECTSCHNPHGTAGERLVKADSVNDLCFSCHQEKRGPFLWEHSPVREDCLTCHNSHGSNHDKLLVARTNQLCQSCHLQGRHQTVAGTSTAFWNTNRNCVNCHAQIHGSNHPSGPLFQR